MSRLLSRVVRLVKFGAVAGAAVGIGRLILRRRRKADTSESSWPTIAETAASNGQPVDDQPADSDSQPDDAEADSRSDRGAGDNSEGDDTH